MSQATLTLDLIDAICTRLRVGAFERVAVEAVGVPWATYRDWLRQGERPNSSVEHVLLADEVRKARAHARLTSEMELRQKDPKTWLLCGPGRETPTQEGWGPASKKEEAPTTDMRGFIVEFSALVLEALTEWPEARVQTAAKIDQARVGA